MQNSATLKINVTKDEDGSHQKVWYTMSTPSIHTCWLKRVVSIAIQWVWFERPLQHQITVGGKRLSGIGVLTTRGMEDVYLVEGSVNGDIFLQFTQRCLLSFIQTFNGNNPRSVVVFDNASIHHLETVLDLITASGAFVRFLPLDLNPIEEAFSQVKVYLREYQVAFRCTESPRLTVASAFQSVTTEHCINDIKHAGYME